MIKSFRHNALNALYEDDSPRGFRQDQVKRLRALLAWLEISCTPADMDFPRLRLHPLKGDMAGFYTVDVSGLWRRVFRFDEHGDAADVDWVDYH